MSVVGANICCPYQSRTGVYFDNNTRTSILCSVKFMNWLLSTISLSKQCYNFCLQDVKTIFIRDLHILWRSHLTWYSALDWNKNLPNYTKRLPTIKWFVNTITQSIGRHGIHHVIIVSSVAVSQGGMMEHFWVSNKYLHLNVWGWGAVGVHSINWKSLRHMICKSCRYIQL